jgi:predicted  nucleic acid-binding Zn-ribbon protein
MMSVAITSVAALEELISAQRIFLAQCRANLAVLELADATANDPRAMERAASEGATPAELEQLRSVVESIQPSLKSLRQLVEYVTQEIADLEVQLSAAREKEGRRSLLTLHSDHSDDDKHADDS